jgi:hypothetical protein
MWRIRKWLDGGALRPTAAEPVSALSEQRISIPHGCHLIDEREVAVGFPIDAVYTWVDKADETFKEEFKRFQPSAASSDPSLFKSNDELRYSLRSLEAYAPWINHVYIVTNGQKPSWLTESPKVTIVHHSEILERQYLPTFNSHVIESALHRIPRLAEHYLYFNDDTLLWRATRKEHFFTGNGLAFAFVGSVRLSDGPPAPMETATNWAAKNARDLVRKHWSYAPERRLAHIVSPQIKSVAEGCERLFFDSYSKFRNNKFRSMNDLLVCGYLNPVAGYFQKQFLFSQTVWWYVKIRERTAPEIYSAILAEREQPNGRLFGCLNDQPCGKNSLKNAERDLHQFLVEFFPSPSSFEC